MKVLKMKFGKSGEKVDAHGVRFFGDFDSRAMHLGGISEMISEPDVPPMIKHRRVTLWYISKKIYPYKHIINLLSQLTAGLKAEGYTVMVSSLDDLVDTTSSEYGGKPESKFPASDRMHGYNAVGGFSVTAEITDAWPKFSVEEIETIRKLAIKTGKLLYGQTLDEMKG
jgi:hypothetical protein